MKNKKGNALIEYVLPLAILLIGGTFLLSVTDLKRSLISDFFTDTTHGEVSGTKVNVARFGKIIPPQQVLFSANSLPPESTMQLETVCFKSGLCLSAPVLNATVGTETAGGMGGDETRAFANVLEQLAKQLEAAGEDPAIVNLINKLANQGHNLGGSINTIADTCPGGTCNTTNMNVINPLFSAVTTEGNSFDSIFLELQTWFTNNPGALSAFPEAEQIINLEAGKIQALADGINKNQTVNNYTYTIPGTPGTPSTFGNCGQGPLGNMCLGTPAVPDSTGYGSTDGPVTVGNIKVDEVHQNANMICTQGGEGSGGQSCYRRKNPNAEWEIIQPNAA